MNANKQTALDTYLARTAAIHAKMERLQQLADDLRQDRRQQGQGDVDGLELDAVQNTIITTPSLPIFSPAWLRTFDCRHLR